MRGVAFLILFLSSLPLIIVSPFYGVLTWYVFSLGNFHTLTWGVLEHLYYAYVIAILTCFSWLISSTEEKRLPLTPLVVLTLLFSAWMTLTSFFALAPPVDVWDRWTAVQKVLFMCLVGYALTTNRERVNQLVWVVVLAMGFWGVKGAISVILHGGTNQGIHGPEAGIASANNEFGIALIMILPLLFYQWELATNRHLRRALMVMGFLISISIIFTYSRGALVGLVAMGAVFWLRSRAKVATGALILVLGLSVYYFVPQHWFDRMATIETYEKDSSAMSRIDYWKISLRIAEQHPIFGGGFKVTYWPEITNAMLVGTNLPRLKAGRAAHSIWFEVLSEQGWIGLGFFVAIALYSWYNCQWLIRQSRDRAELVWANLLGRMGQSVLVGFWTAASFGSMAYFDEYWCIIFIFDAARRIVAKEVAAPFGALRAAPTRGAPWIGGAGIATREIR